MRIMIDAGHGPETPGKRTPDGSMHEYQFNSVVARYLGGLLAKYEGVETRYTFADDHDVPLKERTDAANAWGADVFVSIHANASGDVWDDKSIGIETYVYVTKPAGAVKLATNVQAALVAETGRPNRGVKSDNFHVLRETKMTAILAECGFMTSHIEAEMLKWDAHRQSCARAVAMGLIETYGLKPKATGKYTPVVSTERAYNATVRWIKFDRNRVRLQPVFEKGAKVSQLVRKHGADYGFNFPYFISETGDLIGDAKVDGKVISSAYGKALKWHAFAVTDGKPEIGKFDPATKPDMFQSAPLLIENGNLVWDHYLTYDEVAPDIGRDATGKLVRNTRTFIGIDAAGDFIVAAADSPGLTVEEEALFMQGKGAAWALNGDGGGSAVLSDRNGVLSQNSGSRERIVNHAVLVYLAETPASPPPVSQPPAKYVDIVGHWAEAEIRKVIADGVMEGYDDGTFRPDQPLTRGEFAYLKAHGKI